jgi:1,4-alpha-glucan branching enzyme
MFRAHSPGAEVPSMVVTSRSASSQPPGGRVSPPVPRVTDAHAGPDAPLGATLGAGGATFRVWAPAAKAVYLKLNDDPPHWRPASEHLLTRDSRGVWSGFVAGVEDGARYRYYVVGEGGEGFKRDPYARELAPGWPECDCVVRDPDSYPWHDAHHRTPDPADLVIYELHVGTFYAFGADGTDRRVSPGATFLDLIERIPYLAALGVNAIEPLPLIEFATRRSMGYNGVDLFAPEMRYEVAPADLDVHLQGINRLLAARGHAPLQRRHLESQVNQLK